MLAVLCLFWSRRSLVHAPMRGAPLYSNRPHTKCEANGESSGEPALRRRDDVDVYFAKGPGSRPADWCSLSISISAPPAMPWRFGRCFAVLWGSCCRLGTWALLPGCSSPSVFLPISAFSTGYVPPPPDKASRSAIAWPETQTCPLHRLQSFASP